jgi:outer membrane protein OmpA-like peptidoglycan-associated protein
MQSLLKITLIFFCLLVPTAQVFAQAVETTPSKETETQKTKSTDEKPVQAVAPEVEPKVPTESAEPAAVAARKPHARHHDGRFPGAAGGIGLDRTLSASVGVVNTYRLRARLGGFSASDFPVSGGDNEFIETGLSVGYTPTDYSEVYLLVGGTSNTNSLGKPELIQTQGDLSLGAKFVGEISPMVSAGGALHLHFLSDVGSGGIAWGSTSAEIKGLLSVDMKKTQNEPIRFNLNLGYFFENSDTLENGLSEEPTLIQEFGLRTARYDRLSIGLGLEAPLDEPLIPFVEYEVVLPILVELGRRSDDSNDYSFFSIPHSVALGLRGFVADNLSIEGSVRFGLSDQPYTGVPATPPWLASFAVAYHLDPQPVVIEKTVEAPVAVAPVTVLKTFSVEVADEKTNAPIADAQIGYTNRPELSAQVTGTNGSITSYPMPDGEVRIRVSAKGYLAAEATIMVGGAEVAAADVKLKKDPSDQRGKLSLTVQNKAGRGVAASIQFGGKARDVSGRSNSKGIYMRELVPGRYPVTFNARGFAEVTRNIVITAGKTLPLQVVLSPLSKPAPVVSSGGGASSGGGSGLAVVTKRGIRIKRKLSFVKGGAELTADSLRVLNSLAQGLRRVSAIKKVQIGVHTGGRGAMTAQMKLSRARAKRIKSYLVKKKVDRKRLRVRGFGATKPLAPPLTKRGRQKNQRVEFKIIKVK